MRPCDRHGPELASEGRPQNAPGDAVLASRRKHREQPRLPENQRAVLTGYVLLIIVQQ